MVMGGFICSGRTVYFCEAAVYGTCCQNYSLRTLSSAFGNNVYKLVPSFCENKFLLAFHGGEGD